ncbi:UNVERIFIED_CONTAM: hypothetical protein Sradi_6298200 [Sesamum radiatum]|uniref:Uncharacterized protein n=1 Tax=Sesamum radiatum TaxID=300843 RepID=A0AAW2KE99_SESRA
MATPAYRLVQDQNLNLLYNGATPVGKPTVVKTGRKGGLTGRKALNDISNSRKPSEINSRKKDSSANIISIEKDPGDAKARLSKVVNEKGKVAGRKALTDLTNSVKPLAQQASRAGQKLHAVAEEKAPSSLVEERFLHNHQECIKARMKSVDMDYFLKSVGLNNEMPVVLSAEGGLQSSAKKAESNLEMEEIPEQLLKSKLSGYRSPACLSPRSPKPPYANWDDGDFSDLITIETPKLLYP